MCVQVQTMADNALKSFTFNFKEVIIEEIALEGLQGIGIDLLWRRVEDRISSLVTEKMRCRIWDFIVNCESICFYKLTEPLPYVKIVDRFSIVDDTTGDFKEPDDFIDGPYEYSPIENEYGSCSNYATRELFPRSNLSALTYEEVNKEYGDTLVMVASIEERWAALAPHMPISFLSQLTSIHYCILEIVGKARHNGQMTVGRTNLTKITKDPKLLFYNRKVLQDMDLIKTSRITQMREGKSSANGILLRIKRFHKSFIQTIPKVGVVHNLVSYLKDQPNYCEKTELIIKKGLLTPKQNKRYQKNFSIFGYEEDPVKFEDIPLLKAKSKVKTEDSSLGMQIKTQMKKRYIYLCSQSDESSESEDEDVAAPLQCQYKVGVNLLRQSYERLLEAGLKGLTQMELARLVGMEFYLSRTVCKLFKKKNIVREYLEDKGRQRQARFVAVAINANDMNSQYAEEKEKFEKLLIENSKLMADSQKRQHTSDPESDTEIPKKKVKLAKGTEEGNITENTGNDITELKVLDGLPKLNLQALSKSKKVLTLRQLKIANGLLKVLRDNTYVTGYQTLGKLVSAETNEPPLDSKALKTFLQKLILDGHVKIYKIKWPGLQNQFSILICAGHVKPTDPIIKAKQKDICVRAIKNKAQRKRASISKSLFDYTYPRYVKVQKIHEALINYVYFNHVKPEKSDLPQGFVYIKDFLQELTVETAMGCLNTKAIDINKKTLTNNCLEFKVKDAPETLRKIFLQSKNLYNSIRGILKVLAAFGLIQLVAQVKPKELPDNTVGIHLFYINKHATLIDTSGEWPKDNVVPNEQLQKEFYFQSFEDVRDYWTNVYNISINTSIMSRLRNTEKTLKIPVRIREEVFDCDNGSIYGNGLGACGFDSCFFIDMPRLWKAYSLKKPEIKIPLSVKIPKIKSLKLKKKIGKPAKKKRVEEKITKPLAVKQQAHKPPASAKQQALTTLSKARLPKKVFDSWSREEDRMLMMCKLAISIMSPVSQPGSLQIRNLVAKDILSLSDPQKTQKVCHRRAKQLDSNSTLNHERDCLMRELRQNHGYLIKKYEGHLKKIRGYYTANMTKYINEARLPLMELVWIINQIFRDTTFKSQGPGGVILSEDFFKHYTVIPSSADKTCDTYRTPHEDVALASLKEAIIQTVLLSYNNTMPIDNAKTILSNYERYQEKDLRIAIDQLRKAGSICAKEKSLFNQMQKVNLDDLVQSCYRVTAQYQRKWVCKLGLNYFDNLATYFNKDNVESNLHGAPDLNCFAFEQQANGVLELTLENTPVISGFTGTMIQEDQLNSYDIETKYKLKSGTFGWKSNVGNFADLYKALTDEEHLPSTKQSVIEHNQIQPKDFNNLTADEMKVVDYLNSKQEKGATFQELKEFLNYESKTLVQTLTNLDEANIIKRAGFYENVVILVEYFKSWAVKASDLYIFPTPWRKLDGCIQSEIFINWASVIVNKIFENPACSISYLSESCEYLSCRSVQDICDTLFKFKCVTMHTLETKSVDLFSEDDDAATELGDYNPYGSPQNILVSPVKDTLSRFAIIKQKYRI